MMAHVNTPKASRANAKAPARPLAQAFAWGPSGGRCSLLPLAGPSEVHIAPKNLFIQVSEARVFQRCNSFCVMPSSLRNSATVGHKSAGLESSHSGGGRGFA
eukprot:CAMPEP_0170430404 /NCGR_PEP_ID=MMETSP0117_2-20130122/40837_1 /TAXON_ID=400756 /ORGANISM="Durinskia baltica, Strain CSIRO CS-38" /LENGTH=101 /DNA_ID=CAMNT_0010689865 /DNA_START=78 /DNA_END=380 /DNA_ORIENTATION=-